MVFAVCAFCSLRKLCSSIHSLLHVIFVSSSIGVIYGEKKEIFGKVANILEQLKLT